MSIRTPFVEIEPEILIWAENRKWLLVAKEPNSKGFKHRYLTPGGALIVVQFNNKGEFANLEVW
jgi:hypothetical protein